LRYGPKFVAMLEQLDLFAAIAPEEKATDYNKLLKERRLTPPAIIEIIESAPAHAEIEPAPVDLVSEEENVEVPEQILTAEISPVQSAGSEMHHEEEQPLKKMQRGRKSQKEMSLESGRIDVPEDSILFSKQYYSIGEVAIMFSVNASLLRYWESEFDILKPRKNKKGDRFFRPDDIKNLQMIHHLLREKKYTIDGARDFLKKGKKANEQFEAISKLKEIRAFLVELRAGI